MEIMPSFYRKMWGFKNVVSSCATGLDLDTTTYVAQMSKTTFKFGTKFRTWFDDAGLIART